MPENAADTVIDLYQKNAAAWVKLRSSNLFEKPWLDRFLQALPEGGREILDIGCGSGQPVGAYLIERGCQLTGVDAANALIDIARDAFPEHTWITADMRALPPLPQFHGLIAWHSFFHLSPEAQRPVFKDFGRLCLPGGALMFTSGTTLGHSIGTFEGRPLYHGSLDSAEYGRLLVENGFEVIEHVENDPACGGATIWLARKISDQL
ncbi:MAG: class I SAM-dependent methyltransferase [Alphaproteobacteria bacterium]|nr:class I SAM-dependent methyltransferase [Alphaproteobacteria bacterium]